MALSGATSVAYGPLWCDPGDVQPLAFKKLGSPDLILLLLFTLKRFPGQVRKELEVNGIEFYPQKEFDEDLEDKTENDKIRVGCPLAWLWAGEVLEFIEFKLVRDHSSF